MSPELGTRLPARMLEGIDSGVRPTARRPKNPRVTFVDPETRELLAKAASNARCIVLRPVVSPGSSIARAIDADFESALAVRGAVPSAPHLQVSLTATLADQFHRAAMLPVRGICLALPFLGQHMSELSAEDGRYLSGFLRYASESPDECKTVVLFDELDRQLAMPVPMPLDAIVRDVNQEDLPEEEEEASFDSLDSLPDLITSRIEVPEEAPPARPLAAAMAAVLSPPTFEAAAPKITETLRPPSFDPETTRKPMAPISQEISEDERAARMLQQAEWRTHAVELDAARGPKPVAAIERLFANRYVPLIAPMQRGDVDGSVRKVASDWSQAFAESYVESFAQLRVTGKRPTMVFDSFEVAGRIGRLSNARNVRLVMIDSMSFDLGERVARRMAADLDKRAVLVERTTLWAALPSKTPTQLHLIARGAEGLKDSSGPNSSSEPDVARGRNITTMRREKLGNRELLKLDLVEARLHAPGPAYDERLDALADEVSDLLVMFMESLPPRTLVYVFGDHGFILGPPTNGWATGPALQGGASPEEVLVSGHAWLVDAVQ